LLNRGTLGPDLAIIFQSDGGRISFKKCPFVVRILGNQNMNNEKVLELICLKNICCYACGAFLFQSLKRNQKARQINTGAQGWHPHPLISQSALLLQI